MEGKERKWCSQEDFSTWPPTKRTNSSFAGLMTRPVPHIHNTLSSSDSGCSFGNLSLYAMAFGNCPCYPLLAAAVLQLPRELPSAAGCRDTLPHGYRKLSNVVFHCQWTKLSPIHANHATFQEHKNCHQLQPLWYITSFTPVLCQGDHRNNDVYMTATLSRVLGADAASSATYHLPRFPHISELRIWKVKKHVSSANISIFMVGAEKVEMLRIPPEHLSCQSHWIPLGHHL